MKVAIIGGGAAGFFSAIAVKENHPTAEVIILEASSKLLTKVKVSGGGRCNVTNAESSIKKLVQAYPRGGKFLKKILPIFSTKETRDWFKQRGVPLTVQEDNCVFPKAQDSQVVVDCLYKNAKRLGVKVRLNQRILSIFSENKKLRIKSKQEDFIFDKIIIATGGSPKRKGLVWLEKLGHAIEDPVPSLFTFNMPNELIRMLKGIVVQNVITKIQGQKIEGDGPLLITHWGMSGPAILKLSSFGARILSDKKYDFILQVNWVNQRNNGTVLQVINQIIQNHSSKLLTNFRPYGLPSRLWHFLLKKIGFAESKKWNELGKKGKNKLITILTNDQYVVSGKTTFKEEFVTCGGISLSNINSKTMESKICSNLYFAGEVLDIDGITGGYNFQAAWTTGFIAGKLK